MQFVFLYAFKFDSMLAKINLKFLVGLFSFINSHQFLSEACYYYFMSDYILRFNNIAAIMFTSTRNYIFNAFIYAVNKI